MADDTDTQVENEPMVRRLEEQLYEAHAANGALRERLTEAEKAKKVSDSQATEGRRASMLLGEVSLKLKQAESLTHATVRKSHDAEAEVRRLSDENEELQTRLDRAQSELSTLTELNLRIENAKHVGDLFVGAK